MAERDQTLGSSTPEKATSSSKAALHFPVDIIRRNLYEGEYAKQFTRNAPIHVAAVLEYVAAEVLELAGNAARDDNRSSIRPIHIERAVVNDEELSKLLGELMSQWRLIIEEGRAS